MAKPQNIKGMRDHLPHAMLIRQHIIKTLVAVFERYGFEPLATPVLEYAETLDGKLGDEEKLIYRLEDHGGRKLALRYDQTVPLARVVAQYSHQLCFPWRRYAIGASYRGERPARGRYREFWQADVDIVGSGSPLADAEIIALVDEALEALGFTQFTTLINHRQLLGGIARVSGLEEASAGGVYRAIDKLDKVGIDGVREELLREGVAPDAAERLLSLVLLDIEPHAMVHELSARLSGDVRATAALENMHQIVMGLEAMGISSERYRISPRLARGLSYYTGAVFETVTAHWPSGSLLGGGRYDNLVGMFAGRSVPTVGLAFGIDRLHDVIEELGMDTVQHTTAHAFVTIFSTEQCKESLVLARELRSAGVNTLIALEQDMSLGKQFKEADRKGIPYALVLGPDEIAQGEVVVKDLRSGVQQHLPRHTVAAYLLDHTKANNPSPHHH